MEREYGTRPVFTQGQFWIVEDALWVPRTVDSVTCLVGKWFRTKRYCKRQSDFRGIAQIAAQIATDERFFEGTAVGVATPKNFWAVVDGKLKEVPLRPERRMRTRVHAEPDFKAKAPLFKGLLDHIFRDDKEQRALLQLLFGGALTQSLWKRQVAVLLYGNTGSGKSVLLSILRAMFLPDLMSAVNPQQWPTKRVWPASL